MELIVGDIRVVPDRMKRIPGGIEARLAGDALTRVLDATFGGRRASIEVLGGEFDRRPMDITAIRMQGSCTTITLHCAGAAARFC